MPAPLTVPWTWAWGPAGGLASQASFGENPVFDGIRLAVVIAGAFLMWMCGRVIVEQRRRHDPMGRAQSIRFAALGLASIYISANMAWLFGTTATPSLFVGLAVIVLGIEGARGKRSRQKLEPLAER